MFDWAIRRIGSYRNLVASHQLVERERDEAKAVADSLYSQIEDLEEQGSELTHALEMERTKRIAAEQIAVSRGTELDWLRDEFRKVQESRDNAVSERVQSLDLVNLTLLRQHESESAPTQEQLKEYKPVPKAMQQPVPLMRKAQRQMIQGLREKSKKDLASRSAAVEVAS